MPRWAGGATGARRSSRWRRLAAVQLQWQRQLQVQRQAMQAAAIQAAAAPPMARGACEYC